MEQRRTREPPQVIGLLALIAVAAGCSAAPARPTGAAVAPPSEGNPGNPGVLAAAPTCDDAGVRISVDRPIWNGTCAAEYASCRARLPVLVTNCTSRPVVVRSLLWLVQGGDGAKWWPRLGLTPEEPLIVPPGEHARLDWPVMRDTEDTIQLRASVEVGGETSMLESEPFVLANAAREAEKERCRRIDGRWETLDPSGRIGCRERSRDGGRVCRDGDECEGVCRFERYEVVSPAGERPLGRPVGRCSEFRTEPGCIRYVARGASREAPVPISLPAPVSCI